MAKVARGLGGASGLRASGSSGGYLRGSWSGRAWVARVARMAKGLCELEGLGG